MLGCSVEDPKLATEMAPLLFVPQILFAGFFVSPGLIPFWLEWAKYLCSLTYALRILLVAEFDRSVEDCGDSTKCADLLERLNANPDETWWNWLVLVLLFIVFRVAAVTILRAKANKF
jgi:ABC-type multidrug transport system permease subunit